MIRKGKARVGKIDAILTASHLDTRLKCILMNMIVPKLEYAKVWEGDAKLVKQLETVQMTAARKVLSIGCSGTTSNTVLRAGMGMYPLKTNKDVRKLK